MQNGYVWNQYIDAITKYNAEQLYRQLTIDLQQQNKLDITNDTYQNIIRKQGNSRLNINANKISGDIDLTLIGINNQAKIEGIYSFDNKAKCKFVAVEDEVTTKMCKSLDNQEFYIHDWNEFERYSKSNDCIKKYKCYGLIPGLNLPPINDGFHWCRSTVTYQVSDNKSMELEQGKQFNIFDSKYDKQLKEKYDIKKLNIKHIDKKVLNSILKNMEKVYKDFPQIQGKIKQIKEIEHSSGGMAVEPQKDGTYTMYINKNKFYNEKIPRKLYEKDVETHFHPKGTTYKDMAIHEAGHMAVTEIIRKLNHNNNNAMVFDSENNITVNKILEKSFNKIGASDIIEKNILIKNISDYAHKYKGQEIIAEAFADYYANKNNATLLSKTILETMKGMI